MGRSRISSIATRLSAAPLTRWKCRSRHQGWPKGLAGMIAQKALLRTRAIRHPVSNRRMASSPAGRGDLSHYGAALDY
jgi:hypothetical protein